MAKLFEPLKIRSIKLRNRIVVSPMCMYSSEDGFANDWHLVHLGTRATGGAGLVFTEATAVSAEGRITPNDLGIYKEEHLVNLKRITTFIRSQGAVAGIQLAHAGRKASHKRPWEGGAALEEHENPWITEAPSALPYKDSEPVPHALTLEEIHKIVADFKTAAARAKEAGFQVVELHGAHGYLIHEFLSPLSNQRTDAYGGSFENRIRFLLEITAAVQTVWDSSLPLFVRLSATDWVEGGWTPEESVALSRLLKEKGVDVIDCSSGGNSPAQKITAGPLYQVPFAEQIKQEAGILTGAVGLITNAEQAEEILQKGQADLIFLARQLLRDPYFPLHAAKELGAEVEWPVQYERAKK
ncbi:MAG TPA: NADPH dehydrogenase NamA [Flavisolibacter sp.]|jgi:2,4-dienoyl-CoA reductase-like NADH-dependent reductase (Old Yellow Enzyme family)|nr:NADPH dehydrogenase NamA [Flavisolibacter sp.]